MRNLTHKEALLTVLDSVDYTEGNCSIMSPISSVLPVSVIREARESLANEEKSLDNAHSALRILLSHNRLHHDLDAYLMDVAKWGLGEITEQPDPINFGL